MNRSSSFGQAQRRVNGHEVRPGVPDRVKDVVVAERHVCLGFQTAQETEAGRTAWRTGEIYPDHDQIISLSLSPDDEVETLQRWTPGWRSGKPSRESRG